MSFTSDFNQVKISFKPTPLYKLNNLSTKYGVNIYCLRDDLTGFSFGGNKTRKLDFLIADAKSKDCDTLIAIGAQQSNFCRLAAAAGVTHGMEVHLVLSKNEPDDYTGNLLLNSFLDVNIHYVGDEITKKKAWELEQELLKSGKKPYRMPSGGSTDIGALGYIEAFEEIMQFQKDNNISFSTIFHATGSGGTQSGLVAGQTLYDWTGDIVGISVSRDAESLTRVVDILGNQALELVGSEKRIDKKAIIIDTNYIGIKYGIPTKECEQAIIEFLKLEGIPLDYVYSGKGAAGMIDYIKKGKIPKGENILFIHTGGNVQLFAEPYQI